MSTTSITPMPTPVATPAMASRHRSVRWALARVEGRRLLAHPLVVIGTAFSILILAVGGADNGDDVWSLSGSCFTYFGAGMWVFVVACLAVSRERRDAARDFYAGQPVTPRLRTEAALLSLGWAALAGAALVGFAAVARAGFDGVLVIEGERYGLRPLELAQGPLYLVMVGAFGVLVGTWSRRAYPAVIGALVLFLPPWPWLPWFVYGDGVPRDFFTDDSLVDAAVGWHLMGLAGLAALAAAGALARHDRHLLVVLLALTGLGAAVAGMALGLPPGNSWTVLR
jgi:hypothetical protein